LKPPRLGCWVHSSPAGTTSRELNNDFCHIAKYRPAAAPAGLFNCGILEILVERHPGLVAIDELIREYAGPSADRCRGELIAELRVSGLVHQFDDFVLASRAAVHAEEFKG
jgi:hypothetical protein